MIRIIVKVLSAAAGMLFCAFSVTPRTALAGSVLEVTQETTVGVNATYDNSWSQSFQVSGSASVNGGVGPQSISPYSKVEGNHVTLPNSGTAVVNAAVQICQLFCDGFEAGGVAQGDARITTTGASNSVTLNNSTTNGVPAITLDPNNQPAAGFAANVIGDNIGTASLQVQGTRRSINSNSLTVF
jgi:hypothetical protein